MRKVTLFLSLFFMVLVNCSYSQDIYIKISNNAGTFVSEVQQQKFQDHLQAYSVSFGASNIRTMAGGGGSGTGKAIFSDVAVIKNITQNSPLFNFLTANGANIDKVEIKYVSGGADPIIRYMVMIEDVNVSSVSSSLDGSCTTCLIGTESITFFYSKITWTYYDENGAEKSKRSWNIAANTPG